MGTKNNRLIVVLGMHRSGTSAVTRALALLGVDLGSNLHPAGFDNPKGFWEDVSVLGINEELLSINYSAYDRLTFAWRDDGGRAETAGLKARATQTVIQKLQECGGVWGFKDPRTCRLLPFWLEIFHEINCQVGFVITVRNPLSVADSLNARNQMPTEKAHILWCEHMLSALIGTDGYDRVVVDYDLLLESPYKQIARIAGALDLSLPAEDSVDVLEFTKQFLETRLRHSHYSVDDLCADHRVWKPSAALYQLLLNIAHDKESLDSLVTGQKLSELAAELQSLAPLGRYANYLEDVRQDIWQTIERQNEQLEKFGKIIANNDAQIASINQIVADRDGQIANLSQAVADRDGRIANLSQTVADREGKSTHLAHAIADRDGQIAKLSQAVADRDGQIANLSQEVTDYGGQLLRLERMVGERESRLASLDQAVTDRDGRVAHLQQVVDERDELMATILRSISWRVTEPLRIFRRCVLASLVSIRCLVLDSAYAIWYKLPLTSNSKRNVKNVIFTRLPFLFNRTRVYQNWFHSGDAQKTGKLFSEEIRYVPLLKGNALRDKSAKLICFYLPQFHPIPENDAWWGVGFTEWTNVRPAQPQFEGHHQPHVPGELGYYNLLDPAIQHRQVELAKLYGIEGFCFYFYWFAGRRLLETPIENYLENKSLDLPFCLCWANENWSRRWDGLDNEILIQQKHSSEDDVAFIRYVSKYMVDGRYIRVGGKPLLLVYRPSLMPSAKETAQRWRDWCRNNGIGEICLAYTQSFEVADPATYGFDAAIEFPPNNSSPPNITDCVVPLRTDFAGTVYDGRIFASRSEKYNRPKYKLFRSVFPSWDNSARRKNRGAVFLGTSPQLYQRWLENAINDTVDNFDDPEERLVFVNAWNEWAEGAHLEPDALYGYAYLQATRDALVNTRKLQGLGSILLVTHDCHPHGAQLLTLEIAKQVSDFGLTVYVLALGGGRLLNDFSQIGNTIDASVAGLEAIDEFLDDLHKKGVSSAIANTVVSGGIVPRLKELGFQVVSLIHELPGLISTYGQEGNARLIAQYADKVVFPADLVCSSFNGIASVDPSKTVIRHQGLSRQNPYKGRKQEARRIVCEKHNLLRHSQIVLNASYMDLRKGADLFVEVAALVIKRCPNAVFIWVGHADRGMEKKVISRINELGLDGKIVLAGFNQDPSAYFAAASVYALTSREDPFPSVVLESIDASVPVVAFEGASGAGDFILEHGGRLARHSDTSGFADQVMALLTDSAPKIRGADISWRKYVLDLLHYVEGFPRVSVVVPNYNYARYLRQRLDSISNQSFPIYEVIVLDDASTDTSVKVVEEYIRESNKDISLIQNSQNSGSVFRQWKAGVDACKGDLVWIAEADDLADEGFLYDLVTSFKDERVVLAYSQSKQIDKSGRMLANSYIDYTLGASNCCLTDYCRDGREEIAKSMCIKNTIPNVSAVVFRRQALQEALSETCGRLYEMKVAGDWLVYLHVLLKGKICHSKKSLNVHRRHAGSVTDSLQKQRHVEEIVQMQKLGISMVSPPDEVIVRAKRYVDEVCKLFRIASPKDGEAEGQLLLTGTPVGIVEDGVAVSRAARDT